MKTLSSSLPITRRTLLKKGGALTAGALAAPMIVPSRVFGDEAPSNVINVGLIGCGNIANYHRQHLWRNHQDVRVLALCDVYQDRREAYRNRFNHFYMNEGYGEGLTTAYEDFRDVLARDDIDAVVICAHDNWHVHMAAAAAKAGKHVYVQKPLSLSLGWSQRLRAILADSGVVFQFGTQQRSDARFRRACELVNAGYIGELERVEAWCPTLEPNQNNIHGRPYGSTKQVPVPAGFNYDMWTGPSKMVPYTTDRCTKFGGYFCPEYSLGFVAGWGIHTLDIAQWGAGKDGTSPVLYEGTGQKPDEGIFQTLNRWDMHMAYADGLRLRFMDELTADPIVHAYLPAGQGLGTGGATFFGADGWVNISRKGIHASSDTILNATLSETDPRLYNSTEQHRNFFDCIKSGEQTVSPFDVAFHDDAICHMTNLCATLGRTLRWNPEDEVIVGDDEAQALLDQPQRGDWADLLA